jgi:hypothetical protein
MTCIFYECLKIKTNTSTAGRMVTSANYALRCYCSHIDSTVTKEHIKNVLFAKLSCGGNKAQCSVNYGKGYEQKS